MFGLFRKSNPDRDALHAELKQSLALLRSAPPVVRAALGHSINMAHSIFVQRFTNLDGFRGLAKKDQVEYLKGNTRMVEKLMEKEQMHEALGFRLFGLWLVGVIESDSYLYDNASEIMKELSKEGDLGS